MIAALTWRSSRGGCQLRLDFNRSTRSSSADHTDESDQSDDSDDPATWHPVKVITDQGFGTDTSQPFVEELTVSFHDGMPDVVLNEMDEVEFALPRPTGGSPGDRL